MAKGRDVKTLAGFLREHYTTKSDTAGALAAYVSGFAGSGPADVRNRAGVGPSPPRAQQNAPTGATAATARRRRSATMPVPAQSPPRISARDAGNAPSICRAMARSAGRGTTRTRRVRPPAAAAAPPAVPARTAARTADTAPREAADPLSRLRPYLASGLGYEGAIAEAAKAGHSSSRKRQGKDAGPAPPDAPPPAKADPSPGQAADRSAGCDGRGRAPAESTVTMPALSLRRYPRRLPSHVFPAPTAPAAVVTPPRLGQCSRTGTALRRRSVPTPIGFNPDWFHRGDPLLFGTQASFGWPRFARQGAVSRATGSDMIVFSHLSKSYGEVEAVRDLDLAIERGEVFGFLGPNGAGKTTTIRMVMGILVPSSGRITIDGLDCQKDRVAVKRHVGYLPDNPMFYDYLRGREILAFVPVEDARPVAGGERAERRASAQLRATSRSTMPPRSTRSTIPQE